MVVAVLLAVVPAYAETPGAQPEPQPRSEPKAAPAPAPKAAPAPTPAPAPAQPRAPKGPPRVLPPAALQDAMPRPPKAPDKVTGGMSLDGGFAAGTIVVPPPHPDDQPWPKGMVITPPDVNDPIAIPPGTDGLAPGKPAPPATWSKRMADAMLGGIGKIVDLVVPQAM